MSHAPADPHAAFAARRAARQEDVARWDRWERRCVNARVALALAGVGVGLVAWRAPLSAAWVLAGVAALFLALLVGHDRVRSALERARRSLAFYDRGLARLDDRWAGAGEDGARFLERAHRYAADLDVLGSGSLFQRINTARTRIGEETLADWLLEPAAPDELRARHAAVAELRDRLDLREELSLVGDAVSVGVDRAALVEWAGAPAGRSARGLRVAAAGLALIDVLALAAWWPGGLGYVPFLVAVVLAWAFSWRLRAIVKPALAGVEAAHDDLVVLAGALGRLEREPFAAPRLVALQATLIGDGQPASRRLGRLVLMADLLRARTSPMWSPFAALLLWGTQLGLAVEAWRARNGADLAVWLDTVGEIEALCSLAAYAFECPDDPFPELADDGPRLEATGLGHPLLPDARCVRNDVALGGTVRVLMISGSNMSGKSTLLRAVGANAVLAFAGAPVRAKRITLTPLEVGASILVLDSLLDGTSHFFAELSRLRDIVTLAEGPRPVLFLVDEILHGTNSQDRRVGTAAVVRGLLDRQAIGLATTHDLSLAELADELAPAVVNVHFQDDLVAGERRFDYRLRPGVVTRSNALGLMRSMGLLDDEAPR